MTMTTREAAAVAPAIAAHITRGDDADAYCTADHNPLAVFVGQALWSVVIAHIEPDQREPLTRAVSDRLARLSAVYTLDLTEPDTDE